MSLLELGKLAESTVREHDRSAELRHELLHRLAHPPGGVSPERDTKLGVVTLERAKQPDHSFLHQLNPVDLPGEAIVARNRANQGQECLYEGSPGFLISCSRLSHQNLLHPLRNPSAPPELTQVVA